MPCLLLSLSATIPLSLYLTLSQRKKHFRHKERLTTVSRERKACVLSFLFDHSSLLSREMEIVSIAGAIIARKLSSAPPTLFLFPPFFLSSFFFRSCEPPLLRHSLSRSLLPSPNSFVPLSILLSHAYVGEPFIFRFLSIFSPLVSLPLPHAFLAMTASRHRKGGERRAESREQREDRAEGHLT